MPEVHIGSSVDLSTGPQVDMNTVSAAASNAGACANISVCVCVYIYILLPSSFRLVDRKSQETQGCAYQAKVIKYTF
jgi:hypothetical protein